MPASKKKATKRAKTAKKASKKNVTANYQCPVGIPIPTGPCAQANLPHNVPQLVAELEAYLKCLCSWQTLVANAVNTCCPSGPGLVPPPPPPPF